MSIVNLVSGGLDSTLISVMLKEEGIQTYPLFVNYGQICAQREWNACLAVHQSLKLPPPKCIDISGYGKLIISGLTNKEKDVKSDAFTPGRNLLFLIVGAAYAFQIGANAVAIGLLSEQFSLFPDQKLTFIKAAENAVQVALNRTIRILTPLFEFNKIDVVELASKRGISGTYSCHKGTEIPCGYCVSCLELIGLNKN
ncbi:MAG TPA: 7-cyano-7-deazaguanine synthase [Smithellaceae bacterium]|nr:7-cyano-7-deazaguanine synthase [Smithellaceae bacterium]